MPANVLLWCPRCEQFEKHLRQGKYDSLGHLVSVVERCCVCAHESQSHEPPVADPPPVTGALSDLEIARGKFVRRLIARGVFSDYPHEPGVWG